MPRRFTLCFLVLLLSLNGVWLRCYEAAPKQQDTEAASANSDSEAKTECERLCAFTGHSPGAICLSLAGDPSTSIVVFAIGAAVLPGSIRLNLPVPADRDFAEFRRLHLNPVLLLGAPPPRV